MINDFLANHGGVLGAILYLLTLALEAYLGKTQPLGAASTFALSWKLIQQLLAYFHKPKGATSMSTNPNARTISVTVDGPTYDALGLGVDVIKKVLSGEKAQQVATEELGAVMTQLGSLGQIAGDFALDRPSIEAAVALQLQALVDVILAARLAKAASTPATGPLAAPTK